MASLARHSRVLWLCLLAMTSIAAGLIYHQREVSNGRPAETVQNFVDQLGSGPTAPPGWKGAAIGDPKPLSRPGWHVSTLTRGANTTGYLVHAQHAGQFAVVMYSGSALPQEIIETLSLPEGFSSPATPHQFPSSKNWIGMVAPIDEEPVLKTTRVTTRVTASGLAMVLGAAAGRSLRDQSVPPLFFGRGSPEEYLLQVTPFLKKAGLTPPAVRADGRYLPKRYALDRYARYQKDRQDVLNNPELFDKSTTRNYAGSPITGFASRDSVKAFDQFAAIHKAYLAGPVSAYERANALSHEMIDAEGLGVWISEGMRIAFVLERGYLRGAESLDKALATFARLRGFEVELERRPVSTLSDGDLPCLLLGPRNQILVLLALGGKEAPGWALVCAPQTVVPKRSPYMNPNAAPPASAPAPAGTSPEKWAQIQKSSAREWEQLKKIVRVEDPAPQLPGALDCGAHMIALGALETNWKGLIFVNWKVADNWDLEQRPDTNPSP